ncbi:MAG: hypothetical protein KDA60_11595 [Planctomycetales bacterium]|nr:hypothetical protein [Planctomycetales bacterium]
MPLTLPIIENKSILTETSGFLGDGYTHTINAYSGCSFAGAICGRYCYAQHNFWITKGRPWKLYGAKREVAEAYDRDYNRIKPPRRGTPGPIRIFMSSSTDPYLPQEKTLGITRRLLEAMCERPPDALVIQTRSPLVLRDADLICRLSEHARVWVCITVETGMDAIPGFPPHATPPNARVAALAEFRRRMVRTRATLSPLLPIQDIPRFAESLERVAEHVILDHYLIGDGSRGGSRTKRTGFPRMLDDAGYPEWNTIEKFWEVVESFRLVLCPERVLTSCRGFNTLDP